MPFIVLTIIIVVVVLVAKAIRDAQQGGPADAPSPRASRPTRAPARSQPRPRRPSKPVDEEALAQHVAKLREAIGAGLVTTDEAVASVCRFTDGVLSEEAARELLRRQGAA